MADHHYENVKSAFEEAKSKIKEDGEKQFCDQVKGANLKDKRECDTWGHESNICSDDQATGSKGKSVDRREFDDGEVRLVNEVNIHYGQEKQNEIYESTKTKAGHLRTGKEEIYTPKIKPMHEILDIHGSTEDKTHFPRKPKLDKRTHKGDKPKSIQHLTTMNIKKNKFTNSPEGIKKYITRIDVVHTTTKSETFKQNPLTKGASQFTDNECQQLTGKLTTERKGSSSFERDNKTRRCDSVFESYSYDNGSSTKMHNRPRNQSKTENNDRIERSVTTADSTSEREKDIVTEKEDEHNELSTDKSYMNEKEECVIRHISDDLYENKIPRLKQSNASRKSDPSALLTYKTKLLKIASTVGGRNQFGGETDPNALNGDKFCRRTLVNDISSSSTDNTSTTSAGILFLGEGHNEGRRHYLPTHSKSVINKKSQKDMLKQGVFQKKCSVGNGSEISVENEAVNELSELPRLNTLIGKRESKSSNFYDNNTCEGSDVEVENQSRNDSTSILNSSDLSIDTTMTTHKLSGAEKDDSRSSPKRTSVHDHHDRQYNITEDNDLEMESEETKPKVSLLTNKNRKDATQRSESKKDSLKGQLDRVRRELVEHMEPIKILDEFRVRKFLLETDIRDITETETSSKKNRLILDYVRRKGDEGIKTFCKCLRKTGQAHLADLITGKTSDSESPRDTINVASYVPDKYRELKHRLIVFCKSHYSSMPLSIVDEHDVPLNTFYVRQKLVAVSRGSTTKEPSERDIISLYDDLFLDGSKPAKNIYIVSDVGSGKTTFLKRLILAWCHAQEPDENYSRAFSDERLDALKHFTFVFFIPCKNSRSEEGDVDTLVYEHVLKLLPTKITRDEVSDILKQEKCLIILDGLDEWDQANETAIPQRVFRENVTYLTTTRSWKFSMTKLGINQIDKQIEIAGMDKTSSSWLIREVTQHLNGIHGLCMDPKEFESNIDQNELWTLMENPLIAMHAICIWHEGRLSHISRSLIYEHVLQMLIDRFTETRSSYLTQTEGVNENMKALEKLTFQRVFDNNDPNSLMYDVSEITSAPISAECLRFGFATGITTQIRARGNITCRRFNIMYPPNNVQHFLAARHILSNPDQIVDQLLSELNKNGVSRIENLFKALEFLSEMNPTLVADIFIKLADILNRDKMITKYRECLEYEESELVTCQKFLRNLQNGIQRCIRQSSPTADANIFCQDDIFIDGKTNQRGNGAIFLQRTLNVNCGNLKSLSVAQVEALGNLDNKEFPSLKKIKVHGRDSRFLHVPIEIDRLIGKVTCTLTCLDLFGCSYYNDIVVHLKRTTNLKSLRIDSVRMFCKNFENLLMGLSTIKLESLRYLILKNIHYYTHDRQVCRTVSLLLSRHENLQYIVLKELPKPLTLDLSSTKTLSLLDVDVNTSVRL